MKSFETPILFLVFNRYETTRKVFERIRKARPKYLFVAADGPRKDNESDNENTVKVKGIFKDIDWDCKLITLYREQNLGCKYAVSSAITWFFEQVNEGIIIEDDILPDPSFFEFCSFLLQEYREDERIMHISGFNVCGKWKENQQSYHFSHFGGIWGWATWRRAWRHYDVDVKVWESELIKKNILETYFDAPMREERKKLYDDLFQGKIDTWDYQWTISRLIRKGISIIPSKNLTLNIGFGKNATHSNIIPSWISPKTYKLRTPFIKNTNFIVDQEYDVIHNLKASGRINNNSIQKKRLLNSVNFLKNKSNLFVSKLRRGKIESNNSKIKKSQEDDYNSGINIQFIGSAKPKISIGTGTYINGMKIYCWDNRIEVTFGNYCCIADNVVITAGGEHEKETVSNYPFIKIFNRTDLYHKQKVRFKGNISIGNDVWIGNNVSILSGVTIGDGAVIGAGSNVIKNIEPFGVAVGNPAKVIKYRFEEKEITALLEIQWWNWPIERIMDNLHLFDDVKLFIEDNLSK